MGRTTYHRGVVLRIALLAAVWIIGGCSASGAATGASSAPSPRPTVSPNEPPSGSPGTIDLPASIVDPVVAEIASVAGVPIDQVTVTSAESVTFADGSLGCPEPGMVYTQALVDGYRIVAEAGGVTYDYRGSRTGSFRRCTTTG